MAPVTAISAAPVVWSRAELEEFQATTPATGHFDHPPVLHHLERGARISLLPNAVADFDADKAPVGDIYVTEGSLCFFDPSTSTGFSVPYPTISLHAISRQPVTASSSVSAAHPVPTPVAISQTNGDGTTNGHESAPSFTEQVCVYCQLDENEGADYDEMAEDDLIETKELSIFPSTPEAAQAIYSALSKCAALHPSTDSGPNPSGLGAFADSMDDDEDDEDFADLLRQSDEQDGQEDRMDPNFTPAGRAQLARLESLITYSQPQNGRTIREQTADADETNEQPDISSSKRKR